MSFLQKIKQGKKNHKIVDFPGTEHKVALVILPSNELTSCKLESDKYIEENNIKDEAYQDVILQQSILYRALRDPDNLDNKIADTLADFKSTIDNSELAYFMVQYNMLTQEHSPFLAQVSEEQFEALKKTLEKMNLNELNGESLVALRNFLMSLV